MQDPASLQCRLQQRPLAVLAVMSDNKWQRVFSTPHHPSMSEKVNRRFATAFSLMQKSILVLPCSAKRVVALTFDVVSALSTLWLAIVFSDEFRLATSGNHWYLYLLAPAIMLPVFVLSGIYRAVYRYSGFILFATVVRASLVYGLLFFPVVTMLNPPGVSRLVGVLQPMMFLLMTCGSRAFVRFWLSGPNGQKMHGIVRNRLLIYGAGKAGTEIARTLHRSARFNLVGYLDDDSDLQGRTIHGLPVFSPEQAESLIATLAIQTVLVAIPSASRSRRNEIVKLFQTFPVDIKTLPAIDEIADGRVTISDIKEVEIEDLLGRDPVGVNHVLVEKAIAGKVVMVTGAGGSIGSELCRQILAAHPSKLLLVDNAEFNLYNVHSDLERRLARLGSDSGIIPLLCDVTDQIRLYEICSVFMPAVLYHAAAYKHVPMVEHNPAEGLRNNVLGTWNIAEAAMNYNISNVVLISTDKAVRPTNVMGASKRLCEMIFQAVAAEKRGHTRFSMVRFGNVLGSSGSVVPLFRRQIREGGPLTITHEDITRYFMTIPEAAQLVIQAGAMASGGDVFLLDMGAPVRIIDIARRMVELSGLSVRDANKPDGDIEIRVTGLRPGEKLYEELLIGENSVATDNPRIFKASEHFIPFKELIADLAILSELINANDVAGILDLLKSVVLEYQPTEQTADFLFLEKNRLTQSESSSIAMDDAQNLAMNQRSKQGQTCRILRKHAEKILEDSVALVALEQKNIA